MLAGDVSYSAQTGAGIHLEMAKQQLISSETVEAITTETWQMRMRGVTFTKGGGAPAKLHPEVAQLLTTLDLTSEEEHYRDTIRQRFTVGEDAGVQFAHRALVSLLDWESGAASRASWRSLLGVGKIVRSIDDFEAALTRGLEEGVIHHVIHQQPSDMPAFIPTSTAKT